MAAFAPQGPAQPLGLTSMAATLLVRTQHSLQLHQYSNATFLAERLYAEVPNEDTAHVLATCYWSSREVRRAHRLLQGCEAPHNRYLLAHCCLDLDELYEAERVLLGPPGVDNPSAATSEVPNGAAGLLLLGHTCMRSQRRAQAETYYLRALELDPYLWSAYEALAQLGVRPPPLATELMGASTAARAEGEVRAASHTMAGDGLTAAGAGTGGPTQMTAHTPHAAVVDALPSAGGSTSPGTPGCDPGISPLALGSNISPLPALPGMLHALSSVRVGAGAVASGEAAGLLPVTPLGESPDSAMGAPARRRGNGVLTSSETPPTAFASGAVSSKALASGGVCGKLSVQAHTFTAAAPVTPAVDDVQRQLPPRKSSRAGGTSGMSQPVRRSTRLSGMALAPPEGPAAAVGGGPSEPPGAGRGSGAAAGADNQTAPEVGADERPQADEDGCATARLLNVLGRALFEVSNFNGPAALALLEALPRCHYNTGWVLCQVGRAHFEMVNYAEAERTFAAALEADPYRLEGHEIHSTLLWHRRAEARLCSLAQHAVGFDRHSPFTWVILGNCFSLQKEHDTSIKFLNRAIQLRPSFAYAHTLCGHEFAANEDFDKALGSYRRAILLDQRHYNAWYGLGSIYFRQEKYDLAEYHLRRALAINPNSSPLLCYLGMAKHEKALALQQTGSNVKEEARAELHAALNVLNRAVDIDMNNPLARFQKARTLLSLEDNNVLAAIASDVRRPLPPGALEELLALRELAPKEGAVHLLLGRVYKKLGQPQRALVCMSSALDLNPKDAQMIKSAIHKLDQGDDDDADDEP